MWRPGPSETASARLQRPRPIDTPASMPTTEAHRCWLRGGENPTAPTRRHPSDPSIPQPILFCPALRTSRRAGRCMGRKRIAQGPTYSGTRTPTSGPATTSCPPRRSYLRSFCRRGPPPGCCTAPSTPRTPPSCTRTPDPGPAETRHPRRQRSLARAAQTKVRSRPAFSPTLSVVARERAGEGARRTVFIASKLSKPLLRQSDSACSAIFVSPSLAYAHAMLYSCDAR